MPPSAMTGTPSRWARRVVCQIADSCGMPAPLITRVVQIDPAPTPTLTASAPALASASTPSSVTTLPATTGSDGQPPLIRSMALITPAEWPWAVSIATASTLRATSASTRSSTSSPTPTAAAQRSRPAVVAGGVRELLALLDVLHRDQPGEAAVVVDERQLLDAVALQDRLRLFERRADRRRAEVLGRHELRHRAVEVAALAEADVTVRQDAHEAAVGVGDRHAREPEPVHQLLGIVQRRRRRQRHRVGDHPALAALDLLHLGGLVGDREVAVDDADAALAGHRDGHARLGDLVHRGRHERDRQRDVGGERGCRVDACRATSRSTRG